MTLAYNPPLAEQVNARLEAAYARTCELVRRNEDAVRFLADALIEHDTLEGNLLLAVIERVKEKMVAEPGREG